MAAGWVVVLDGVMLSGGDDLTSTAVTGVGCLTSPPDGMGVPGLRTEDVTYPQRDGVTHFSDWYDPRVITLTNVVVCPDSCPGCPTAREKVRLLLGTWSRRCDDAELVIFTDCHSDAVSGVDRAVIGPFGVVGRPRVASVEWMRGKNKCATALLRFDAQDHRLFILDADGTPGSGGSCVDLSPEISTRCRTYPRCYDMCYDVDNSTPGTGPVLVDNIGDLCAPLTITLTGSLTTPEVTNDTTGQSLVYDGIIPAGSTVVIDTATGTATQGGVSRTHLLVGSVTMFLNPGTNQLRVTSQGPGDTGTAQLCWRPSVLTG